jgi:hypothetical protein
VLHVVQRVVGRCRDIRVPFWGGVVERADVEGGFVLHVVQQVVGRCRDTGAAGFLKCVAAQNKESRMPTSGAFRKMVIALTCALALLGCATGGGDDADSIMNPSAPPERGAAFVLTTDFSTGSYSVVDLATRNTFDDIGLGGVSSDAIARVFNGLVYVVNRLGVDGDNIQLIDPQQGYQTIAQESVGNDSNPQDIAVVGTDKAYVSRLNSDQLLIIDPHTLMPTGNPIDLSGLTTQNDLDGVPELFRMLVHNGLLYVLVQHIDFTTGFPPAKVAPGEVVVIDPATDTVQTVIQLHGTNPNTDLQFSPGLNRILVSSQGDFLVNDGGIEAINPDTRTVDAGFVISEAAIGGDISHFQVVSASKGYAVVVDANFDDALVSFDPTTGQKLATLLGPVPVFLSHFAVNSRHELYLAVTDTATPTPGVRIFDTMQDVELTGQPLGVGELPPVWVAFIDE